VKNNIHSVAIAAFALAAIFQPLAIEAQIPPRGAPAGAPAAPLLSPEELQALVGRVALYPDDLLALVLPASTTPLDIVKGQRFLGQYEKNKELKPDPAIAEPVINLLTYPEVVTLMSNDLDWTEALGQAVHGTAAGCPPGYPDLSQTGSNSREFEDRREANGHRPRRTWCRSHRRIPRSSTCPSTNPRS